MTGVENQRMKDLRVMLSTLWIFYVLNSAYGDITTLYNRVYTDHVSTIHYTQAFILLGALIVEPATLMVLLSRILKPVANRRANLLVGGVLTAVNVATLFVGTPTLTYAFLTSVMILTGIAIVWSAFTWVEPTVPESVPVLGGGGISPTPAVDATA